MSGLRLLFRAVNRAVPAVWGESPRLVALHGQQGFVPGFRRRTDCWHHGNVQVAGNRLIGSWRVRRIKGEFLCPRGKVVTCGGRVHVFLPISRGRLRCTRLYAAVMGHSARVVAAPEVPIRERRAGWVLGRGARAALLHRLANGGGGHLAGRVSRAGCQRRGVPHEIPTLIRSKVATGETLHVLTHFIGTAAVVVEEHHRRVNPARTEKQWRCHSTASNIEACGSFLKSRGTEKRRYWFPGSTATLTRTGAPRSRCHWPGLCHVVRLCKEDGKHQPAQIIQMRGEKNAK